MCGLEWNANGEPSQAETKYLTCQLLTSTLTAMEETSPLQREIRQGKPFRSRGQEVVVALIRTSDLVRRAVGRVLEPYDITLQQYNVMRILRGAGERGLPTLEIAERMVEHAPGVTRLLDRLEAKGLVRRQR